MSNEIVETIVQQLRAGGFHNLGKMLYVKQDENTLKIAKGMRGVIIHYNYGKDTYEVSEYNAKTGETKMVNDDVYCDELAGVAAEALKIELIQL